MTWLLCDYGEVLSYSQPENERAALVAASGCIETEFWAAYWGSRGAYDRNDLSAETYWTIVLGVLPSPDQLRTLIALDIVSWLHVNPVSVAAALRASQRGYRLAILSNAPIEIAAAIDAAPSLAPFAPRVFSCRLGEIKPDMAIFVRALERLVARPEEVIFFDDRPINVTAAQALGIKSYHFTNPAQFDDLPSV